MLCSYALLEGLGLVRAGSGVARPPQLYPHTPAHTPALTHPITPSPSTGAAEAVISESRAMQQVRNPFVVTLHYAFQDASFADTDA